MNHNNTVYIHKDDEKALLGSFVGGSFSEDLYVDDATISLADFTCRVNLRHATRKIDVVFKPYITTGYGALNGFFQDSPNIKNALAHVTGKVIGSGNLSAQNMFQNCQDLESVKLIIDTQSVLFLSSFARYCTKLKTAYIKAASPSKVASANTSYLFNGDTVLDTLIIDVGNDIFPLANINSLQGTPFYSGGTGGTIYIPKALYDHLGDNSSLDYKAATNWSTINGYGTITWAQIEGSEYEEA